MADDDRVELRPYGPEDRAGFAELVSTVLAEYGFRIDPCLEADLADPPSRYDAIWIAADGDEIVGSAAVRLVDGGSSAELKRMYLKPAYRGVGLGRALLDLALEWAEGRSCRTVELDTSPAMAAAQRLYEAAGFRRSGERTETGRHDSRCEVLYTLRLSRNR